MSDDTMPDDAMPDDPEEEITPRVRTMKRAAPVAGRDGDDEPAFQAQADEAPPRQLRPQVAEEPEEPEDDDDEPEAPIHKGWTAGQQVMDATSQYAQALRLGENAQIIKFLEDEPYANYRRHWVDRMTAQGPSRLPFTCLETVGRDCPLCNIADRAQAVSAFNVVLVGDDGQVLLRTWDVGARLFNVLKAYAADPKVMPLTKGYFSVSQTGRRSTTQTNVTPIRANRLEEDYEIAPPTEAMLRKAGKYDAGIIRIPKKSEMDEVASEISEE